MKKLLTAAVLLAAPGTLLAASDEAADMRFAATLGYSDASQGGDKLIPVRLGNQYPAGSEVEHGDGDGGPTASLAWFVSRSVALELWGAGESRHDVEIDVENAPDVGVAGYKSRPLALSAQYHFRDLGDRLTPFVGLGYHRTRFSVTGVNPAMPKYAGLRLEDGQGLAATVGLDVEFGARWFARADARYLRWNGESRTAAGPLAKGSQHSLIYGASIGVRF